MVGKGWWILLIGVLVVAGIRYLAWKKQWLRLKNGQRISVTDRVRQLPEPGKSMLYVYMGPGNLIKVDLPAQFTVNYNDKLTVVGTLEDRLISDKNIGFKLINSDISTIPASGALLRIQLIRKSLVERILKWLPGDEGGLAAGIILGGSQGISENGSENFRLSGLTHIVAASGYNLTVVAGWVIYICEKIAGKRKAIYFAIVSIIMYIFLAGATSAVIRAGIMSVIAMFGLSVGRKTEAAWTWVMTAIVMIIFSPSFVEDVGWQLSVASTGGLILLTNSHEKQLLMGDLKTTLAAQATTLPIILHYFGRMSVISPISNILVLWTIPIIMQVNSIAVILGLFIDKLGMMVAWISWPLLKWVTLVTEYTAGIKWSNVETGNIELIWVIGYYVLLILIVYMSKFKK